MAAPTHSDEAGCVRQASSQKVAKVTLRMPPMYAALLARRARAADVAQGQYVCAPLDGAPASPLPADHSAAVAALRASTDRVAAMSVDLNAFLRLLGRVPNKQLDDRKRTRLLQRAQLKYPSATIEDASFEGVHGIDRSALMSLALSTWIERGETICFGGATGLGKTWLACALAQYACRQGHSALYLRVPRLGEELRILHGAGSFRRWLQALAKVDVLVLDDWGTGPMDAALRADLLKMIDDRSAQRATIITHQLPIEHWHAWLGDLLAAARIRSYSAARWRICLRRRRCEHRTGASAPMLDDGRDEHRCRS